MLGFRAVFVACAVVVALEGKDDRHMHALLQGAIVLPQFELFLLIVACSFHQQDQVHGAAIPCKEQHTRKAEYPCGCARRGWVQPCRCDPVPLRVLHGRG